MTATVQLAAVGEVRAFRNGREFAAWLRFACRDSIQRVGADRLLGILMQTGGPLHAELTGAWRPLSGTPSRREAGSSQPVVVPSDGKTSQEYCS